MLLVISCEEASEPIDCVETVRQNGITFVDDKKFTGQCYIYAVDGKIVRLKSYKRGEPSGVHKAWYHPTGILAYEGSRKNGEIHGKYVGYHENGAIQAEGKLKKGFYVGKWKYYNDKGELFLEKRFINGKAVDSTYINK